MGNGHSRFATMRRDAAPLLLGVFLLAVQLAPVAHLATHRADHTHGPAPRPLSDAEHDAAHREGRPHAHDADVHAASHPAPGAHRVPAPAEAAGDIPHDHHGAAPHSHGGPAHDHGRASISHFGVALIEGPPPPFVPAPAEALALPPDGQPRPQPAPALSQPPVRGPPLPA